jgi:nucleoside-diphosphate-sugar epimerase
LGPVLTPLTKASDVEQGDRQHVYAFINGGRKTTDDPFAISYEHVDVRDVALAHVLALNNPSAGGQRILLCSPDVMSPQTVVNSINKHYPQLQDRVASGDPSRVYPPGVNPVGIDGSKALKVFGPSFKYTSLETSVRDVVGQILENESKWQ